MKITAIDVIELRVPGWRGDSFDGSRDDCVIRIHTDGGITGIAEVDSVPAIVRAVIEAPRSHTHAMGLKHVLIGEDPSDVEVLWQRMYEASDYHGRRGVVIHAISGIDMALWDIRAKALGKPLCEVLGGKKRDKLLAYGTIYPLGATPDEVKRNIDRGLKMGLRAIKIAADPFWRDDLKLTEALVRAARAHVGPSIRLMVDLAGAITTPEQGVPLMPIFHAFDFAWVEAPLPVDDVHGHRRFQGFRIPIGGGDLGCTTRFEYEQMLDLGEIDIAQPDISMAGGFTEVLRIARLAKARGKRLVPHGYKTNILIAANLAFLAQHEDEEVLEYSTSDSPLRWELTNESFDIESDGTVRVPAGPGLGVSLSDAALAKFKTL
jgi:L-rhamnonate dehydratase